MDETRIGYCYEDILDLEECAKLATENRFEFFIGPIIEKNSNELNSYCDYQIEDQGFLNMFVAEIKQKISNDDFFERKKFIENQIDYCTYLGLPAIFFYSQDIDSFSELACILSSKLRCNIRLQTLNQIWVSFNISQVINNKIFDPWLSWCSFRNFFPPSKKIYVILEIENNILPDLEICKRWSGETVKALIINTNCFKLNQKGFPILTKVLQNFIYLFRKATSYNLHLLVKGKEHNSLKLYHYFQYLNNLKKIEEKEVKLFKYIKGYEDYLQIPLQPLMDNLESMSYQVFEHDTIKYKKYKEAIELAMLTFEEEKLFLLVVGAGRGPLVQCSIEAAEKTKKKLKIFIVEKNKNAITTLNYLNKTKWSKYDHITTEIVCVDIRDWKSSCKADIIVSELLGSFGDNELSPECLDGVWKFSKKNTISIPQSYTSYLAPIMTYRVHTETSMQNFENVKDPLECQYVVYLRNFYLIDEPQSLFHFNHINLNIDPKKKDNRRFKKLSFKPKILTTCHGFVGYFESTLFGDIKLSTVEGQQTVDMVSWFPLWIPINSPFNVEPNQNIEVSFWRMCDKHKVWYEWTVTSPKALPIHNINGRSQIIGF